jgi:hypothetical protein
MCRFIPTGKENNFWHNKRVGQRTQFSSFLWSKGISRGLHSAGFFSFRSGSCTCKSDFFTHLSIVSMVVIPLKRIRVYYLFINKKGSLLVFS